MSDPAVGATYTNPFAHLTAAEVAINLDEYEAVYRKMTDDVLRCEDQLSQKSRKFKGRYESRDDYLKWRAGKHHAITRKTIEKRTLRPLLQEARRINAATETLRRRAEPTDGSWDDPDAGRFLASTTGAITDMLHRVGRMEHYLPNDADFQELLEDARADLEELMGRVTTLSASAIGA